MKKYQDINKQIRVMEDGFLWEIVDNSSAFELMGSVYELHDDGSESLLENEEDFDEVATYGMEIGFMDPKLLKIFRNDAIAKEPSKEESVELYSYFILFYKGTTKVGNGVITGTSSLEISRKDGIVPFLNSEQINGFLNDINKNGKDFVLTNFKKISKKEYEIWQYKEEKEDEQQD